MDQNLMKPILKTDGMNKTEHRFSIQLEMMKQDESILDWQYEAIKFRLGPNTFYTPDFLVIYSDRFEIIEIKGGYIRDDAAVKFKVAAERFPWFKWKMYQMKDHGWKLLMEI